MMVVLVVERVKEKKEAEEVEEVGNWVEGEVVWNMSY